MPGNDYSHFCVLCCSPSVILPLRIRDILVRIRISGSVPLRLLLTDPSLFVSDLQDANKKYFYFLTYFAYYSLKVHVHNSSKIKSHKEVTK
jgi:hypothetical protein